MSVGQVCLYRHCHSRGDFNCRQFSLISPVNCNHCCTPRLMVIKGAKTVLLLWVVVVVICYSRRGKKIRNAALCIIVMMTKTKNKQHVYYIMNIYIGIVYILITILRRMYYVLKPKPENQMTWTTILYGGDRSQRFYDA